VPVALSAALCYLSAQHFKSGRSRQARAFLVALLTASWIGLGLVAVLVAIHL
jgi:hypothetical protein